MKKNQFILCVVAAMFALGAFATENEVLLAQLGEPVHYTHSDPAYQPEALKLAFEAASEKAGFQLVRLDVDSSEYPPLLYGEVQEGEMWPGIKTICEQLDDTYTYNGAVSGSKYFAVDIIPNKTLPKDLYPKISKRRMHRLSLLNDCVSKGLTLEQARAIAQKPMPCSRQLAVLLEQGIYTEETVGDLPRAIEIYSEIVAEDQANRNVVAEALLRLGKCHATEGHDELALEELQKLVDQYPDQQNWVAAACELIDQLSPAPIFPELAGCRLKYSFKLPIKKSDKPLKGGKLVFYQTDIFDLSFDVDPSLEGQIDRFELSKVPAGSNRAPENDEINILDGSFRSGYAGVLDSQEPGLYDYLVAAFEGTNILVRYVSQMEIKPARISQLGVNDIQSDGTIRFVGAMQQPGIMRRKTTDGFINSDFVHVEEMFDETGGRVEFTETHEGNHYRYRVTLNKPTEKGETHFLGYRGWEEGLIQQAAGSDNVFQYRMNHSPSTGSPVRRVEIFRLPAGAELLSTTPSDLPHRVLEDGRVELLVDTVIPAGGSLLTEFRYRLERKSDEYVAQINALKKEAHSKEQLEAVEQIAIIAGDAEYSHESLVKLAGLAAKASLNHQRIVKAAEIASKFCYHSGGLISIAGVAERADHECEELDQILELVVLKLSGTMNMIQLAKDAVKAEGDLEKDAIRDRIEEMRRVADYQTLEEARVGQKDLFERMLEPAKANEPLSMLPAPWKDGEALIYRLTSKDGMEMGAQIWTVDAVEQNGTACWEMEQRLVVPASSMSLTTQVIADQERFAPLSSWSKHTMMGKVSVSYESGKAVLTYSGSTPPKNITFDGVVFDNDQALYLIRRLPLTEGYKASFSLIAPLSGQGQLNCRIKVLEREKVRVPAGEVDCWRVNLGVYLGAVKAMEQEFFFAVEDDHAVVKVVTPQGDLELVERRLKSDANEPVILNEQGLALTLPVDWFSYELPSVGKDAEIVRLLPPEMKLDGMLCKTMRPSAAMGVDEIAQQDIEMLKDYFKNYTVRKDSVAKKEINGVTAIIYAADYEEQGRQKVEYRAYYVAGSRVFWFVFRMDADKFDASKAEMDQLIEGLKL